MPVETVKLTIRLPRADVEFAKDYARAHGLTVTEVIDRHLRRMRELAHYSPSPAPDAITGLVPSEAGVKEEYCRHLERKHA